MVLAWRWTGPPVMRTALGASSGKRRVARAVEQGRV